MISAQLERLQRDSAEYDSFIQKLQEQGDHDRASKLLRKKAYLDNRIAEIYSN